MKLRHRLALTFALAGTATLVLSRVVTMDAFRRVQQYELDQGLMARAKQESSEVAVVGRKALEAEYVEEEETNPLEQLVTYGALYRADGTLVADTPSFMHAPALQDLGIPVRPKVEPPSAPFDFRFRGSVLRGVLVEVSPSARPDGQFLLVAASRRDMDADARQLIEVGWWVLAAMIPFAALVGAWLGRRMTHGIESVAAAARRMTDGDLEAPLTDVAARDDEVAALANAFREMVARLKRLLDTERRFAAHAAHELRSPLAALRGELELALRRPRSAADYEETLKDVLEDTNRLIALSEDLLVVARLGGMERGEEEDVEIGPLIEQAVSASLAAHRRDGITIAIDPRLAGARLRGNPATLARVLRNVLDNAVTHGGKAGIRVDASRVDAEHVAVRIEDDGPGITDVDPERVFEHFHRGESAREHSGAGLGLGIARDVARQHGGDVVLESPSKPTRFVVTLPFSGGHRQT